MGSRTLPLLSAAAMIAVLAAFAVAPASAQSRPVGGVTRITIPSQNNLFSWERGAHRFRGGFGGGFGNVWVVEREVPVVVRVETPAPPPQAAANSGTPNRDVPEIARKPYVIGASYASLPGPCMKLIEDGVSYYYCSGDWYRQVGDGRGAKYVAVERRL